MNEDRIKELEAYVLRCEEMSGGVRLKEWFDMVIKLEQLKALHKIEGRLSGIALKDDALSEEEKNRLISKWANS
jgi:hypothetical protein